MAVHDARNSLQGEGSNDKGVKHTKRAHRDGDTSIMDR